MLLTVLVFLCGGAFDLASGSTPAPLRLKTVEESLNDLYDAIAKVERRDRSELARMIKREIMVELENWAARQKEQTLAEVRADVEERLLKEMNERTLMDDQILTQVRQLQRDTLEKVTSVKNDVTSVSERGRIEADMLEVRIKETEDLARLCLASQRDTEETIRRNVSLSSAEVRKTLTDHTSEISSIDTRLNRVENRCSNPPHVENGHLMDSGMEGRDHEDVVTYACQGNKVMAGNDTLRCLYGKWTGELPRCVDHACGLDSRNVGGNSSSGAPSRPWMAAVYRKGKSRVRCTGSIIHQSFILTSGYCVHTYHENGFKQRNATDQTVRLGLTDTGDLTHLQEHNVRTIHVHPLYNTREPWDYDIALLELEKPIDYDLFVGPVCLPPRETPEDNRFYEPQSSVHLIGWAGDGPSLLEYPAVIQPQDICERRFLETYGRNLPNRLFCAAPSGVAGCPLDRRGLAAVQSRPDGRGGLVWTQVAVGRYCLIDRSSSSGSGTHSFLFSRLQHLVPWVEETVGGAAP